MSFIKKHSVWSLQIEWILCYRVQLQFFSADNLPALIYVGFKSALSAGKLQDIA